MGTQKTVPYFPRAMVSLGPTSDDGAFQGLHNKLEHEAMEEFEMTTSSSPNRQTQRSSPSRGSPKKKIKSPKLITNDELATRKAERVANDLRRSTNIFQRANLERNAIKSNLEADNERRYIVKVLKKKEMLVDWGKRLERSPFLIDQVAESERIDEEQRVKLQEEARRQKLFEERKNKIKTEIILRALVKANDLEALRQEKRLINEEERRLKAITDLKRRSTANKKDEMLADVVEEKKRRNRQAWLMQRERLA